MKGKVIQFRRGRHRVKEKHFILDFGLKNKDEAEKLKGKDVVWKSQTGKEIKGKVSSSHGNKGLVRAIFEKGLPGQALTTEVEVKGVKVKEEKKLELSKKENSGSENKYKEEKK